MKRAPFPPIPVRLSLGEVAALAEALSCLEARRRVAPQSLSRFQLAFRLKAVIGKSVPDAMPTAIAAMIANRIFS